ncbi:MAG: ABC transporter ATP-binding protein, partial [Tissierellia bacterium]|nr:ABC transporter ATP-binding protein [Tissierellia bacterium]
MAKYTTDKKVLIRVENLKKYFPLKKKSIFDKEQLYVRANDDISLDIYEGETLGLVGESGCGKSTLGRTLLQLYEQTDGRTIYYGRDIEEFPPKYVSDIL